MSGDDRSGPLGDLADEIRERRERRERDRATDDVFAEAFETVETDDIDGDALWEGVFETDEDAEPVHVSAPIQSDDVAEDRDVRMVSKGLCHGCGYFAKPPEFACTHEGTEILELADGETFCVADCPMVDGESLADRT